MTAGTARAADDDVDGARRDALSLVRARLDTARADAEVLNQQLSDAETRQAQLEGAILIGRDGIAVAACMYLDVPAEGITLSKGLGSRHWSAAAISKKTEAIAVAVSQSSGTVRIFQDGEVVLHIEPLARPHIWQPFRLEAREGDDGPAGSID